jgi:hypothetical protein
MLRHNKKFIVSYVITLILLMCLLLAITLIFNLFDWIGQQPHSGTPLRTPYFVADAPTLPRPRTRYRSAFSSTVTQAKLTITKI